MFKLDLLRCIVIVKSFDSNPHVDGSFIGWKNLPVLAHSYTNQSRFSVLWAYRLKMNCAVLNYFANAICVTAIPSNCEVKILFLYILFLLHAICLNCAQPGHVVHQMKCTPSVSTSHQYVKRVD